MKVLQPTHFTMNRTSLVSCSACFGRVAVFGTQNGAVFAMNLSSGAVFARNRNVSTGRIRTLTFGPDGQSVVTGAQDAVLVKLRVRDLKVQTSFSGPAGAVRFTRLMPDSEHLLVGSDDRALRIFPLDSEQPTRHCMGLSGLPPRAAFPRPDQIALYMRDGTLVTMWLKDWEVASQREFPLFDNRLVTFVDGAKFIAGVSGNRLCHYALDPHETRPDGGFDLGCNSEGIAALMTHPDTSLAFVGPSSTPFFGQVLSP